MTAANIRILNINGYLMPWDGEADEPIHLGADDTDDLFVAVFSTQDKLQEFCAENFEGAEFEIKVVGNGHLPYWYDDDEGIRLRIIVDPRQSEDGMFEFSEILREEFTSTQIH